MDWFSDTEKVRAPLKITFALQRSLFALTFVQLTEIAYLSHFSWPHQSNYNRHFNVLSRRAAACRRRFQSRMRSQLASSPTMPRRNNSTQATKTTPWITSTHSPTMASLYCMSRITNDPTTVSYTHLRAHETDSYLV